MESMLVRADVPAARPSDCVLRCRGREAGKDVGVLDDEAIDGKFGAFSPSVVASILVQSASMGREVVPVWDSVQLECPPSSSRAKAEEPAANDRLSSGTDVMA